MQIQQDYKIQYMYSLLSTALGICHQEILMLYILHLQGLCCIRFRPADIAFFSSESDKNVTLIFCKVQCLSFSIYTHHHLKFDLRQSSTSYSSGLHKKSVRGENALMFSREKLDGFSVRMRYASNTERNQHTNITARLPKKPFLPTHSMPAKLS